MRYLIDAWLDEGDPHLKITDADSGAVRLQWIYHRTDPHHGKEQECPEGPACAGCTALHCLVNHLFLLACADKLAPRCTDASCPIAMNDDIYSRKNMLFLRQEDMPAHEPGIKSDTARSD